MNHIMTADELQDFVNSLVGTDATPFDIEKLNNITQLLVIYHDTTTSPERQEEIARNITSVLRGITFKTQELCTLYDLLKSTLPQAEGIY